MTARCQHGAKWYVACPWCELANIQRPDGKWPFWRNMTNQDALAYIDSMALKIYPTDTCVHVR